MRSHPEHVPLLVKKHIASLRHAARIESTRLSDPTKMKI